MTEEEMSPMLNKLKAAGFHGTSDIIAKQGRELLSLRLEVEWLQSELAAARAQALEEAAKCVENNAAALDHPSVYMGGPSSMAKKKAGFFAAAIRALIKKEP